MDLRLVLSVNGYMALSKSPIEILREGDCVIVATDQKETKQNTTERETSKSDESESSSDDSSTSSIKSTSSKSSSESTSSESSKNDASKVLSEILFMIKAYME